MINMEMVSIPKDEYERLKMQLARLRELETLDFDLLRQLEASLEDVRAGRIRRVA
jgi:PHD/YefM family antitoxin component YafN of YafNO toxin-antitoxin module